MNDIIERQKEFQRLLNVPIDDISEKTRDELGEIYLFKAIEEIIELRKEFPSVMNPWSKIQQPANMTRIKEEFADVLLFLINFVNAWQLTPEEIMETLRSVQDNNFRKAIIKINQK